MSPEDARRQLRALLGDMPERGSPQGRRLGAEGRGSVCVERWLLDLNGREPVPALLTLPRAPRAIALYGHAHGHRFDIGKHELLDGRPALAPPAYGYSLAGIDVAALAIDHWGFGERATKSEQLLNKRFLWEGSTLWGMRVADTLAAFDWLACDPRFAVLPVIALGISMGGTMAWWAAALEPRIAACVDLCSLAEFDSLQATNADDLHAEYYFVPGLRKQFTAASINALIAPRPHLSCTGERDPLTPPSGVASVDRSMRDCYAGLGSPGGWRQRSFPCGHSETPEMRATVLEFIARTQAPLARA